jgi:hypothetical protein
MPPKTMKLRLLFTLIPLLALGQKTENIRLFYLGGQSNMDGFGYTKDLPDSLMTGYENVYIFHGNPAPDEALDGGLGLWETLKPGHGRGFVSNGKQNTLGDRFGVELSMAKSLQALYPGEKIAFIKYSRGGTSLDSTVARHFGSWEPDYRGKNGINQYDHFLKTLNQALAATDIDGNGITDHLIPSGIVWMQGESDAANEEVARKYEVHLKRMMDLIRAALRQDDIPVVIGKISDSWNNTEGKVWKYGELVQHAQETFVRSDERAAIIRSTRYYAYSDPWHYNSAGYIDLGQQFAEALYKLLE